MDRLPASSVQRKEMKKHKSIRVREFKSGVASEEQ